MTKYKGVKQADDTPSISTASSSSDKVTLKRDIGVIHATTVIMGIVIGSGIFVSPKAILQNSGSIGMSLIIWILSGILSQISCMCIAELGGMYPRAGGIYAFILEVLGPLPAFLSVWSDFLIKKTCFYAVLALTSATYIIQPFYRTCDPPSNAIKLIAMVIVVLVTLLNCGFIRNVTRVQTVLTGAKVCALLIVIIGGIVALSQGKTENLQPSKVFEGTTTDVGNIALALYSGMFTYSGWEFLFMLLEEVRDPNKNVPRAVHTSFISVIALYILTNIAYFSVMTPEEVLNSNAVAVTFAERTIGPAAVIIPIFVACSCAGALNGAMLGGSRVTFAAGREGHLPEFLSMISVKYFTPWPALMIGSIIGFIYICEDGIISLIEYMSFVALIEFLIVKLSLLYLRWKKPNDERPVKVNIVLAMCTILSDVAMTFLALYKQPTKNGIAILLVLSGVPVYLIGVRWKSKPKPFLEFMRKLTHTLQKTLMVVPPASIAKPDGDTHKDV